MYHSLFVHLPSERQLGGFPVVTMMIKAAMNFQEQVLHACKFQLLLANSKE
jgi:hypothetical protein